jgi:hypothetical protein
MHDKEDGFGGGFLDETWSLIDRLETGANRSLSWKMQEEKMKRPQLRQLQEGKSTLTIPWGALVSLQG